MELVLLSAHQSDHYWLYDAAEISSVSIQKCISVYISMKHLWLVGPRIPDPWVHCFYLPHSSIITSPLGH